MTDDAALVELATLFAPMLARPPPEFPPGPAVVDWLASLPAAEERLLVLNLLDLDLLVDARLLLSAPSAEEAALLSLLFWLVDLEERRDGMRRRDRFFFGGDVCSVTVDSEYGADGGCCCCCC